METKIVANIHDDRNKKHFDLKHYTLFCGKEIWDLKIYDFRFYIDDGYKLIFDEEFTSEEDALEALAWKMNELHTFKWSGLSKNGHYSYI